MKIQSTAAALVLVIGLLLMAGKIYFDSEPGLVPLLLVAIGAGWLVTARVRSRRSRS